MRAGGSIFESFAPLGGKKEEAIVTGLHMGYHARNRS